MARFITSAFADEAAQDLSAQIAACKANGISAIEVRGVNGENVSDITPAQAKEIKRRLDKEGIEVSSVGSRYGKCEFDFEAFKQTVEVARILGTEYIRMFSFYEGTREERFGWVKQMADYSMTRGVKCCHENEGGIYGESPECCKELLDHCGENLGCVFDFANFLGCGYDAMAAYELLKPYITYFHIKDNDGSATVPAGEGKGRIAEILSDYDQSNYGCVWLSIEPHLKVFAGLGAFDRKTEKKLAGRTVYATQEAAFAAAAGALHRVIAQAQPVAVGIVGFGGMGSGHASNYLKGDLKRMRVVAAADINPDRLEAAQDALPGIAVYDSAEGLIAGGLCDAVVIATPHYFHPPIAIQALGAGLHVMTEKPAGVYTKQVREMNEAAAKTDKVFAIMYNQRSNPLYRKMRELIQSGRYGEVKRVLWIITDWYRTQAYYNSGGWRATWSGEGGGVLINQDPHQLDLWQWLCGMPDKITATCHEGKWHDIEVEDDVTIYAEYPNGATGMFVTTTGEAEGTNRLEIAMDQGKLVCEDGKLTLYEFSGSTKEHIFGCPQGFGSIDSEEKAIVTGGNPVGQHAMVMNAFAEAVVTGNRDLLYARGEEGINGLSISNAAHLSSWLGRPVGLPVDEDLYWAELQKKIAGSKAKAQAAQGVEMDLSKSFH
ncbi:MAG: Gfo/Idh/MocA family oxidoreductase [Oscillospiraceae bacterium]|jgi:predicted dehydrogenase/sugar phosphate isomerase/epimerase|nr:Gfo/Idh/MocA family oxidoreductase [Oscillospiraceae bacterium]